MIAYRLQISYGKEWATMWFETLAEARATQRDASEWESHIDKIELSTDKASYIRALNHVDVNRVNWDGEHIK